MSSIFSLSGKPVSWSAHTSPSGQSNASSNQQEHHFDQSDLALVLHFERITRPPNNIRTRDTMLSVNADRPGTMLICYKYPNPTYSPPAFADPLSLPPQFSRYNILGGSIGMIVHHSGPLSARERVLELEQAFMTALRTERWRARACASVLAMLGIDGAGGVGGGIGDDTAVKTETETETDVHMEAEGEGEANVARAVKMDGEGLVKIEREVTIEGDETEESAEKTEAENKEGEHGVKSEHAVAKTENDHTKKEEKDEDDMVNWSEVFRMVGGAIRQVRILIRTLLYKHCMVIRISCLACLLVRFVHALGC